MARLKPLSPANCPRCKGKNTKRVGYSEKRGGSLWACTTCQKGFILPMMVLKKS